MATLASTRAGGAAGAAAKKVFVLVHGGWFGGWCWKRVAAPLRARGHTVFTPTFTGLGERKHLVSKDITMDLLTKDILHVLEYENLKDIILLGHSFAGGPITGVADQAPHLLRSLVYLDALILPSNKSPFDINPPEVANARRKLSQETSGGLTIPVPDHSTWGIPENDVKWVTGQCVPHPISSWESKLQLKNPNIGNNVPATYIASASPYYYPTSASREYAKTRKDWKYVEIPTGHCPMISHPELLIDAIVDL
jgi:pimeloyl-ACP methyl ester carboxylesterase